MLSCSKGVYRYFRKTLVAILRRRIAAQCIIFCPHHLAVSVTDRQEFLERVNDRRIWQCVARLTDQIVSKKQSVLKMNYVRFVREKEVTKRFAVQGLVTRCHIEQV